jgi:bifunctional non-homologous end joining protein LigD
MPSALLDVYRKECPVLEDIIMMLKARGKDFTENDNIRTIQVLDQNILESEALRDTPVRPMPKGIKPMLATPAKIPFDHPDWIFEVKWDGYRAIAEIRNGSVSLYSRNGISFDKKFPTLVEALQKIEFDAVLDGEIVVVDDEGRSNFQMLQNHQKSMKGHLLFYVFDLPYFQGHDLTKLPLIRRKEVLKMILPSSPKIILSKHVWSEGILFYRVAKEKGLEGIIAKHSQSTYQSGKRSSQWFKVKTRIIQECVIAGFTPGGGRKNFRALVMGVFEGNELRYVGRVGSGFTANELKEISKKLNPIIENECPFKKKPVTNAPVIWVKPDIVCEVTLSGWTDDAFMRQPVFLRLREDKYAHELQQEVNYGQGISIDSK